MTDLETRPPSSSRFRRKPLWVGVAVAVVVLVAVGLALFQPWKIFTRNTVDEALPVAVAAQNPSVQNPSAQNQAAQAQAAEDPAARDQVTTPEATTSSAIAPGAIAPQAQTPAATASAQAPGAAPEEQLASAEAPPAVEPSPETAQEAIAVATEPIVLADGTFVDGEHSTSGTASVLQLPDGSRFVRLEGFSTSDGPDVQVWVTDQQAGGDDWGKYDDGRYIPLGSLKGTDGNQNYAIPADADLSGLTSVVIWCDRFNVAFGSAEVSL